MDNKYFIIVAVLIFLFLINLVRQRKITIKESFWWVTGSIGIIFLAIFPYSIDYLAKKLGIGYPPSLLFLICIVFLLFINFRFSRRISDLQIKIIEISQELAILKEKVNNEKKK